MGQWMTNIAKLGQFFVRKLKNERVCESKLVGPTYLGEMRQWMN